MPNFVAAAREHEVRSDAFAFIGLKVTGDGPVSQNRQLSVL